MKLLSSVVLSLLLFSVSYAQPLRLHSADAADPHEPVLDSDGDPLRAGNSYYIVSAVAGGGGGVAKRSATGFPPCPEAVVQLEAQRGDPVTFRPANTSAREVRLSTDTNIIFIARTPCADSTSVWNVHHNHSINEDFIETGGIAGHPGSGTLENWFKVVRGNDRNYKITYCPSVCRSCAPLPCRDIGVTFSYRPTRRLNLMDTEPPSLLRPFQVQFQKARSF